MGLGKHTSEAITIKNLEETIRLKDETIIEFQKYCAEQFKQIKDLCFANDYGDRNAKLRKIYEIASDNFSQLVGDIVISEDKEKAKIIELPTKNQHK